MLVPVLLFALGLILLIKGGDWFVDGATGIAHRFHIPELLIGATVVAAGTTLPEVMVSATSALSGHSQIAYGNAMGSIICNTALIAAITIAVRPPKVDSASLKVPVLFFFGAAAVYTLVAVFLGEFTRWVGLLLLGIFLGYMIYNVLRVKKLPEPEPAEKSPVEQYSSPIRDIVKLVVGAACIAWGADLLVDNGTLIAQALGVPESVIALTFVALGTSLPELVTAITSLVKGHGSLSLGNIIGANLFNLGLVSGLAVTLTPFTVPASKTIAGMNASLVVDIPLMLFVMAFMTLPAIFRGKLQRWQGVTLLCIYAAYIGFQFFG
ncbi:MAG: calcium/sodium antiporter [Clostridia bacterium]|nr:calcium/sodium antiporter [Clostridia bacterium]